MVMTKPDQSEFTYPDQPNRAHLSVEGLALLILIPLMVLVAIVGFVFWRDAEQSGGMDRATAIQLTRRGDRLLGGSAGENAWIGRLVSGQVSPGYYLSRQFIAPAYLKRQAEDETFLSEAYHVLTGQIATREQLEPAQSRLLATGSRLEALNSLLELTDGQPIRLPSDPTRLRTFTLAEDRPPAGSDLIGLFTLEAEARLTGDKARFRIYSDGRLRCSQVVAVDDPTVSNNYFIEWDTRVEKPGVRQPSLLVQTADGRGLWLDLDLYNIPVINALTTGIPVNADLDPKQVTWFRLPITKDGAALLTLIDAAASFDMRLFDIYSRELSATTTVSGRSAALRAKVADQRTLTDGVCYVAIDPADAIASPVQLIPALAAARPLAAPDQWVGVVGIQGEQLLISEADGSANWQPAENYQLINPSARLSHLLLTLPDGVPAEPSGRFDPESLNYGLVVGGEINHLILETEAMEGRAARIQIDHIAENGEITHLTGTQPIPLAPSENRLRIRVDGFTGDVRLYEVNILRPPHTGGFHLTLDPFPASYHTPIWFLHLQRPTWHFRALATDIEWTDLITAQTERDKSLVSSPPSPSSWVRPGSPVYDGAAWKAAATPVVEHFTDPRNFLNEIDLFQFEKMVFDPAIHTRSGLEAIFAESFLAAENADGIDYAAIILRAGQTAGISPYFLAAKIIQEMGYQGESTLAHGTLAGHEGYYNFYNIGATPNPAVPDGARINGARFARYGRNPSEMEITADEEAWLLPWTTPERAIIGGAIWIAQLYVRPGQDTLYLQKFDLIEDGGLFTRQYAQNIQMAWSEGRNTRRAYASTGLLDQPFVFEIPVFLNMPDRPRQLP